MKICWKCTHRQAIQDVEEFVSSSKQIWISLALHHLLTNGFTAANGCRQNESQTADKSITTSKPNDSGPSINKLWSENLFVCKKQIYN